MGIELAISGAALALGAISTIANIGANAAAASDRKKSFDASTAANNVQVNTQTNNSIYDRRARIREQRVRLAAIKQGSENAGTAGSSGEGGAASSLTSNFGSLVSQSRGANASNIGLNKLTQTAAEYDQSARNTLAWNEVFQQGVKTTQNVFNL